MNPWAQLMAGTASSLPRQRRDRRAVTKPVDNPWGLTAYEKEILDAIVAVGHYGLAGDQVGIAKKTVECYMRDIRQKMGVKHQIVAAVVWDRFRRADGKAD